MYNKLPGQILEYHRSMLIDSERTHRFQQAIQASVQEGDIVIDLGCGTGILSLFACQAGAKRVYAIEMGDVIEVARMVCKDNGFKDRVVFINDLSTHVSLPERADVLVTETIGNFGLEEGILEWVIDARQRLLKASGKLIPQQLELCLEPIEAGEIYRVVNDWQSRLHGYGFSTVRPLAANQLHWVETQSEQTLSTPQCLGLMELDKIDKAEFRGNATYEIQREGILHGFAGWFRADLCRDIQLSNLSLAETPSWRHAFLPCERPMEVRPGNRLEVQLNVLENGSLWNWNYRIQAGDSSRDYGRQSTFFGQLLSPAKLSRRAVGYQPKLNQRGEADLMIFRMMDGVRSLEEIAQQTYQQFPDRFANLPECLRRVRDLSQTYSE